MVSRAASFTRFTREILFRAVSPLFHIATRALLDTSGFVHARFADTVIF
jgi:hypothetical protein